MKNLKEMLMSPEEQVVVVLGGSYLRNYLATGQLTSGFSIVTDKRVYFKGKLFRKDANDKHLRLKQSEYTVDLEDVTGTTISKVNTIIWKILYLLVLPIMLIVLGMTWKEILSISRDAGGGGIASAFAILCAADIVLNYIKEKWRWSVRNIINLLMVIITSVVWICAVASENEWVFRGNAHFVGSAIPFIVLYCIFKALYIFTNKKMFKVQYAGGEIYFQMNKYAEEEIKEYERELRLAKDRIKQRNESSTWNAQPVQNIELVRNIPCSFVADELLKYTKLLENNAITPQEYEEIKKKLLSSIG